MTNFKVHALLKSTLFTLVAVVSLERTFYSVSEDVDVVEVCALVSSPRVECPIEFPFEISISSGDNTAGVAMNLDI